MSATDLELLEDCRAGDTEAFSLVWDRHYRAGLTAARGIAPTLDAEDLVSEAYLRIFELTTRGRGPTGAFRPYLYQVIRSVAVDRLRLPEHTSDELDQIPDLYEIGPWEDNTFDRNAVAVAFATLNERWQAALWYTEVEGMPPREASTLLGISANSVSALAVRAREALKSAWVEAHVNQQLTEAACQSTRRDLQRYQRGKLTSRASREVEAHLDECETCANIAAEFSILNRQLGLVLGTIFLGGVATAAVFSKLGIVSTPTTVALNRVAGQTGKLGIKTAAASSGIGATVAMASGLTVVALAVLGGATLVISNLVLPPELASPPEIYTESTDDVADREVSAASTDDVETVNEVDESSEQPDGISDEIIAPISRTSTSDSQPSPVKSEPVSSPPVIPAPPVAPAPPVVEGDPALAVFDVCRSQYYPPEYFVLEGSAVEHGVVQGRITQGVNVANIPVDFDEFTPPINPGDPWRWSSTHQSTSLISLTPLSTWGLENDDISNVTVELRFIADDDRYSPWVPFDSSVNC